MRFFANAQNDFEFSWFLREGGLVAAWQRPSRYKAPFVINECIVILNVT